MALFRYSRFLTQSDDEAFDSLCWPGQTTPHSGIYRCEGCGREIASNGLDPLPPQNHHQHATGEGPVRWRMIIYAQS